MSLYRFRLDQAIWLSSVWVECYEPIAENYGNKFCIWISLTLLSRCIYCLFKEGKELEVLLNFRLLKKSSKKQPDRVPIRLNWLCKLCLPLIFTRYLKVPRKFLGCCGSFWHDSKMTIILDLSLDPKVSSALEKKKCLYGKIDFSQFLNILYW